MRTFAIAGVVTMIALSAAAGARQQAAQATPAGTAAIAGRVTDAASGQPIENAALRLVSYDVMRVAKTVTSDAEGRYEFSGLAAGRYNLNISANRYVTQEYGQRSYMEPGRPIDVADARRVGNIDVALVRTSAIEGVVLDEFGDPAPNVLVRASQPQFVAGRRRLMPVGQDRETAVTNDVGRFRLTNLPPGTYYLAALSGVFKEIDETGGFAPTFYPGALRVSDSTPIEVPAGQDVTGLSFALAPSATVAVSGQLLDPAGQPVPQGNVVFMAHDTTGASALVLTRGVADRDGRFEFRNVPSGEYTIQAFGRPVGGGNLGRAPFGWLSVTVADRPLSELVVRVVPGRTVTGRITFAGGTPGSLTPRQVRVSAGPIDFESAPIAGGPPNTVTRDDWTFEVQNMSGRRVIRVSIAAPDWTVERITRRGQDITDTAVDFADGDVADVEIVLTDRITTLEGTVSAADGQLVDDGSVSVVVFASDSSKWPFPSRFVTLARPNQTGRFRVTGLPPALYLVAALPAIPGNEWQNPEYLERLRAIALTVTLTAGQASTVDVRLPAR